CRARWNQQREETSGFGIEQSFTRPRVLGDVGRSQQTGNNCDTSRARRNHLPEIVDLNSADAKSRDGDFVMNPFDARQSDRLIIRLRWRRENWAEADVIRAFAFGVVDTNVTEI